MTGEEDVCGVAALPRADETTHDQATTSRRFYATTPLSVHDGVSQDPIEGVTETIVEDKRRESVPAVSGETAVVSARRVRASGYRSPPAFA